MTPRSKSLVVGASIAGGLALVGAIFLGWIGTGNGADRPEPSAATDSEAALLPVTGGAIPTDTGSDGKTAMSLEQCEGLEAKALKVVFADGDSFGDRVAQITDWRPFSTLEFTAFNPASARIELILTIKDRQTSNLRTRVEKTISLRPGKTPVQLDLVGLRKGDGSVPDWANVTKWYLACEQGTAPTLYFGDFWLTTSGRPTAATAGANSPAAPTAKTRPAPTPAKRASTASPERSAAASRPSQASLPSVPPVGPANSYRISGTIGGQRVDLIATPIVDAAGATERTPSVAAPPAAPAAGGMVAPSVPPANPPVPQTKSSVQRAVGAAATVVLPPQDISARLARIRAAKMPAITQPVTFDTAEADAIVSALEVYPPDNAWNQIVADWPVHPNSAKIVASIGVDKPLRYNTDMAFILVPADQKRVPVAIADYSGESDPGPYPVPEGAPIEGWPAGFQRDRKLSSLTLDDVQRDSYKIGGDRHCSVVDPVNRILYEFYQMRKTEGGWQAAQASIFDLKTNALRPDGWTSADAAGLPIFPAVVRYDELQRGLVEHALRVTVRETRRAYAAPATHFASRLQDEHYPRMGERLRLKRDFAISEFSPPVQAILKGLKQYGMLVADNGIEWAISVTPDARIPDLHEELRGVKGSAFEVVVPPR